MSSFTTLSMVSATIAVESEMTAPKFSLYLRPARSAPYAPMEMPPMNVSSRRSLTGKMRRMTCTSSCPTKRP